MHRTALTILALGLSAPLALAADIEPNKPDKQQYNLFNPTPDDKLRDFNTDRPTKVNVPYTVDAGHVLIEGDAASYTYQKSMGVRTTTITGPSPTSKIGLTSDVDLEVNFAPIVAVDSRVLATGQTTHVRGVSDLLLRAKINLWGNDGGKSAFALIPWVKSPTAPDGIGNGATEAGIISVLSLSLPDKYTLVLNSEVDSLKNLNGGGFHASTTNVFNLSRTIAKDVVLYGEIWTQLDADPAHTYKRASFDTALQWNVTKNFQLDIGANFGLTRDTPQFQLYTGVAQRF